MENTKNNKVCDCPNDCAGLSCPCDGDCTGDCGCNGNCQSTIGQEPSVVRQYVKEWEKARDWVDKFTKDFNQLENLVDTVVSNTNSKVPMVGDVTLASAVRQIPRQAVQQMPTMSVELNGTTRSINAILMSWVLRRIVFNKDNFGMGILSRAQLAAESAFTHGFQVTAASFGSNAFDLGVNMQLVHHRDFGIEVGVMDFADSSFYNLRTRVTKSQLQRRLENAKANTETTWNVANLQELLNTTPAGTNDYMVYTSDLRKDLAMYAAQDTYDIITRYGVGPYYSVTVFEARTGLVLRESTSNSKFGYPRLQALVIDPAQLTPFGISRVRLASAPANYANIYQQSTAKMMLINADPPTFEKGEFIGTPSLRRGARIRGVDPTSDFKVMNLDNGNLQEFRAILTFIDNQILNVMGVTSGTIGLGNTDTNYSRNAAGVNMEKNVQDITSQQITNILEQYLRQFALTALDVYVSEQARVDEVVPVIIDDEAKDAINELAQAKYVPQMDPMTMQPMPFVPPVGDDNTLQINWKELYEGTPQLQADPMTGQQSPMLDETGEPIRSGGVQTWTINIDMSMGKQQLDQQKLSTLQDMHTVLAQTADPNDPNDMAMKNALTQDLVETASPDTAALASDKVQAIQAATSGQAPMVPQGQPPAAAPAGRPV